MSGFGEAGSQTKADKETDKETDRQLYAGGKTTNYKDVTDWLTFCQSGTRSESNNK